MKIWVPLFFMAVAAMGQEGSVTGKWSGIFLDVPVYITLKQNGSKLAGIGGPTEKQQLLEFRDGSVEGDHILFAAGTYHFDLRLAGDIMRGEVTYDGQVNKIYLKRVPDRSGTASLAFEVVSVEHSPAVPPGSGVNSSMKLDPGRLTCTNVSLKKLILNMYDVKDYQVSGPAWMDTELFDIVATMPRDTTGEEVIAMAKTLLADRFHLAIHKETKEVPVYGLVVGKNGMKLKEVEFGRGETSTRPGKYTAKMTPMTNFTNFLSRQMDRPVIDMTGLKGFYSFELEWTPEESAVPKPLEGGAAVDSAVGPSLMSALQQLGLKLEPRRAPVETLVIDRADRTPTEN
uniref:Soil-associated protein, TIGR03435 family n=1 Tax=Solibacter usitatus (strain Ellin6076) TaxID=234267 RepID=Q022I4_SOLUE